MAIIDNFDWNARYEEQGFYIPGRMMGGLERYVMRGVIPGGTLCAVLANNLSAAVGSADDENIRNLPAYVFFLVNKAPSDCWGSTAHLVAWAEAGGWLGMKGKELVREDGSITYPDFELNWETFKNNLERRHENGKDT